jgi:hypothetical protein
MLLDSRIETLQSRAVDVLEERLPRNTPLAQHQINIGDARPAKVDGAIALTVFQVPAQDLIALRLIDDHRAQPEARQT